VRRTKERRALRQTGTRSLYTVFISPYWCINLVDLGGQNITCGEGMNRRFDYCGIAAKQAR
jgi:hypothetical protein